MTKQSMLSIASLINVLDNLLLEASHVAVLAREAITQGKQNQAIGSLLPAVQQLDAATAVLRTIITLHRCGHDNPQ